MKNTAFIALGANLKRFKHLSLQENIQTSLKYFSDYDINLIKISNWYKSEPYPKLNQPWYVNSVAKITTNETSENLISIFSEKKTEHFRRVFGEFLEHFRKTSRNFLGSFRKLSRTYPGNF